MSGVSENISEVLHQIREAAGRAGRNPSEIGIVAVTKTVPVEKIKKAVACGIKSLGENRVQELSEKYPMLHGVEWHLIGHLQSNKVKYIADIVTMIHSLDSLTLADEINKRMSALGRTMDVLVQVNVADESTKYGIMPQQAIPFIETVGRLPGLRVKGLMTIAPFVADPEEVRWVFRHLRMLAEEVKTMGFPGVDMKHLSMGMSNDYIIAVEEGATLVRIGSTIFGHRR